MRLKLTFLNDEPHSSDFFGNIFVKVEERPFKGETLVSVSGEEYEVKKIIFSTITVQTPGLPQDETLVEYQLKKLRKTKKRIKK